MSRVRLAQGLRVLSYGVPLAVIAWSLLGPGYGCRGAGCMGYAVLWLLGMFGSLVLGALLNAVSFALQSSPRSRLRKLELWLFATPALFLPLLTLLVH